MHLRLALLLAAWLTVPAQAQPSATLRPTLLASASFEASYSSREEMARGADALGGLAIRHSAFSVSGRRTQGEALTFVYGAGFVLHDLDAATALPLPDRLIELSVNLGLQRRFSPTWSAAVYARPGLYSDFEDVGGDSLNLPLLALAHYTAGPLLTWSFGVNANPMADRPVLPVAGVRWQFAPDWTFSLGYPRAGFNWRASAAMSLRAGVEFQGGSFRVTENLGVPAPGIARLAHTRLDYREIRVGAGVDHALREGLRLTLDAGVVTDRKFDYIDRAYRLDSDTGFFASLSLQSRF